MRIIEQFIKGKKDSAEQCEDGIAYNDCFAAVIDGVTSKSGFSFGGKNPGRIAMELIRDTVLGLNAEIDAASAIREINQSIRNWYRENGFLENMRERSEERCAASLVVFSAARNELWFAGDCQALVDGEAIQPQKKVDLIFGELRAMIIHAELEQGKTEQDLLRRDTSREKILDLLKLQTRLQNIPRKNEFAYYIIDGFDWESELGLRVVSLKKEHGEIVLASDGYPKLFPSLAETESSLANILKEDPLCYKLYRSTKGCYAGNVSFDDRCYLRFNY